MRREACNLAGVGLVARKVLAIQPFDRADGIVESRRGKMLLRHAPVSETGCDVDRGLPVVHVGGEDVRHGAGPGNLCAFSIQRMILHLRGLPVLGQDSPIHRDLAKVRNALVRGLDLPCQRCDGRFLASIESR